MAAAPTDSTIAPRSASLSSPSLQGPWSNRTFRLATKALVTALGVFTIWRYAWMSDDALITLRTSLNWAHGYGPVFNPDERVAGYTHPLWMALLTLMGAVSGSWIVGTLITSVILAGIALGILVFRSRNLWQLVTTASFVLLSNTLVNWGTSGLEGPLAIALLSGLFVLQSRDGEVRHPLLSGFVLSLLLLCRMDYLLLLAPWLLWATKQTWIHPVRTIRLWTGLTLPLAAWALISWQYYGFILPSTFEAKTNSSIAHQELVGRGLDYLRLSFGFDPAVLVVLVGVSVLGLAYRERPVILWTLGSAAYLGYVVWIGGDYMLGRFLLVPTFAILLATTQTSIPYTRKVSRAKHRLAYVVPLVACALSLPSALLFVGREGSPDLSQQFSPIVDERFLWIRFGRGLDPFGLVDLEQGVIPTDLAFLEAQANAWPSGPWPTAEPMVRCGGLGAVGFLVPGSHIIDSCGLTDRFMASRRYEPQTGSGPWKAGHFERPVPSGYLEAVKANDPSLVQDSELARELMELWTKIRP